MSLEDEVASLKAELVVKELGAAYEAAAEAYRSNPTDATKAAYQEARDKLQKARNAWKLDEEAKGNRPGPNAVMPETVSATTEVHSPEIEGDTSG